MAAPAHVEPRFQGAAVQAHAAQLGMWVFLASEVLFFSALFTLYAAGRAQYPHAFATGAGATNLLLGTVNTYLLVAASFLVALAVHAVRAGRAPVAVRLLLGAAGLGLAFLALKGLEYAQHLEDGLAPGIYFHSPRLHGPGYEYFFTLYFAMTGLHALHVTGGIVALVWLAVRTRRQAYGPAYLTPLELGGMYWHFVDVVWLFLWPMFYLLR